MIGLALALRMTGGAAADVGYLVLAGYALLGRAQAIQALALSWLFTMISPGVAADATLAAVDRISVLFAAAGSVLLRSGYVSRTRQGTVLWTLLLGLLLLAHSLVFSLITDVSVLKVVLWTLATSTLLAAWSGLSVSEREAVEGHVFGGLVLLLLCSMPLLAVPLGYLRNGTGFQGVLSQPQAFGPVMALLGAWAGSRMLAERRPRWWLVSLFGACAVLVVMSEARTAGVALVLGIPLAAVTGGVLGRRSLRDFLPGLRSWRVHAVLALSILTALLLGATLVDRLGEYMSKRSDATNFTEAYGDSRGVLTDPMWVNIEAQPTRGIGFGVGSAPEDMIVERDPFLGLPIGASIEKGIMPLAVFEELGVFGFIAVMLWLWMLVRRTARDGGMPALAVVFTVLLTNMGESTLFSPSGLGMLPLILLGWAATGHRGLGLPASRA